MQKRPASRIDGQLVDVFAGNTPTRSGSSEMDTKDPIASAAGPLGAAEVTTTTGVGTSLRIRRNCSGVKSSISGANCLTKSRCRDLADMRAGEDPLLGEAVGSALAKPIAIETVPSLESRHVASTFSSLAPAP